MATTQQKTTVYSQKINRGVSNHTTMENNQFIKEGSKRGRKELQNSQKIINKTAVVSLYLSIITISIKID